MCFQVHWKYRCGHETIDPDVRRRCASDLRSAACFREDVRSALSDCADCLQSRRNAAEDYVGVFRHSYEVEYRRWILQQDNDALLDLAKAKYTQLTIARRAQVDELERIEQRMSMDNKLRHHIIRAFRLAEAAVA